MIEWGEPRAAWMAESSPARTNRMALRTNSMRYAVVIEKGERNDSACAGARDVESARRAWRSLPRMRRLRGVPNAPTSNAIPAAPRRDAAENGSVMAVPGLDPGLCRPSTGAKPSWPGLSCLVPATHAVGRECPAAGSTSGPTARLLAADPDVVLRVAGGIVRIAAGIVRAAIRLSGGIDRLIGVAA